MQVRERLGSWSLLDGGAHRAEQLALRERLHDVAGDTGVQRPGNELPVPVRREHDDRHVTLREDPASGFVPPHLLPDEDGAVPYDEVIAVSTADAFDMARRAAAEEGIWGGPSGGANLVAAIRVAKRLGEGRRVLTVQCDSGMKYLNGDLYA